MSSKPFRFKQFTVAHDRCVHKVGTDGVLLGSWVDIRPDHRRILDVGTGTGVIALMLAQRTPAHVTIDALEIGPSDAQQAAENVANSPWRGRIRVLHKALQEFRPEGKYDLIVSNPPYFNNSLLSPDDQRARARHSRSLTYEELLTASAGMLGNEGRLALILPPSEAGAFMSLASSHGLLLSRKAAFRSRRNKPVERIMMELSREKGHFQEEEIVLYEQGNIWTKQYQALTKDFYLNPD